MKSSADLPRRRKQLQSIIGGNARAIAVFQRILSGEQPLAQTRLLLAEHKSLDLMAEYRMRLAEAQEKVASAQAELEKLESQEQGTHVARFPSHEVSVLNHRDFYIGKEFWTESGPWRCTDVGTRTICAIRLVGDPRGWAGPPYGVPEVVFDERHFSAAPP